MTTLRHKFLRAATSSVLALCLLAVVLCPPLYRMDCMVTGSSVSSFYAPKSCRVVTDAPASNAVSSNCCKYSKVEFAADPYDPVVAPVVHVPSPVAVTVLLPVSLMPPATEVRVAHYDHGPPVVHASERAAQLGVFRV